MYAIDASPSSWIQAFSICLHESAPLPSDSWLCLVLHITLLYINEVHGVRGERCDWSALHLSLVRVQPQMLGLWQLTILTRAFHPLSDHTTGDHMAPHLWRPTSTSLYIKANTTCFQQKYSCLHGGSCSPRGVKDATTADSKSKKKKKKVC